jgi:glycosyltransferase involved in cell wall biosynthesis
VISILAQLRPNDELIVSVDASNDGTKSLIKKVCDPRVKVVDGPSKGINMNFTNALRYATGDAILFSDQDDEWLDGRIDIFLEKLKLYDFVFFDAEVIDKHGNKLYGSYFKRHKTNKRFLTALYKCRTLGCCIGFKKNSVGIDLNFNKYYEKLPFDYSITLLGLALYKCYFTEKVYHRYRRHEYNVSTGGGKANSTLTQKISFRIRVILYICKHIYNKKRMVER